MSVADIDAGETITVGEVTYEQTNAGFIKKGETDQILDVEGWTAEDFTYNFEDPLSYSSLNTSLVWIASIY